MAIDTLYEPLDLTTGTVVADETYTDVGSGVWGLGEPVRPFTGLTLSTGAGGTGDVLTLNTDYTLEEDSRLTTLSGGTTIYRSITVINATYQTGTLYSNYTAHGSYVEGDTLSDMLKPIGTYDYYDADFPNAPALSSYWVLADGSTISDTASPFNGYRSRNYNGANVLLTGVVWASGVATIPAVDVTALAIGDDVSGGAIAANTYISNIVGTTVTLTDTAISVMVDTTFTNDGRFLRGGATSGAGKKDQMQLIEGSLTSNRLGRAGQGTTDGCFTDEVTTVPGDVAAATDGAYSAIKFNFSSADSTGARTSSTTYGETAPIYTAQAVIFKIK